MKALEKLISSHKGLYQKNLEGKVIFIRHGETNYNRDVLHQGKKLKADPNYIDCHLNSDGEEQAKSSAVNFKNLDIEEVYVSPLFRTLQSATLIFRNHPKKDKIIFKVHPLLTEVVSGVHNFTYDIQKTKSIFNMNSEIKVDWSIFDKEFVTPINQDLFYFKYIDLLSEKRKTEEYNKLFNAYNSGRIKDQVAALGKVILDLGYTRLESLNHLFQRSEKLKKFLKQKHSTTMPNKDKKIILVSHLCFGKILTSKACYNLKIINDYPKDSCEMGNCQAISLIL